MIYGLDVRNATSGLYDEFKDVAELESAPGKEHLAYENIGLVSPAGYKAEVGFMDGTGNQFNGDRHAINTRPEHARHLEHDLILKQSVGSDTATLSEEDWGMYLEGIDDWPTILDTRQLAGLELSMMTQKLLVGSFVVPTAVSVEFGKLQRQVQYERDQMTQVREHGLEIIANGDVVTDITDEMLAKYATRTS